MASSFPPPPVNTIDWSNVGFRVREVNGHIESQYSQKTGQWSPLRFVTDPYMRIHGMAAGLNYGVQAYEGLKAFRAPGDQAISVFRPDRNAERMRHSAAFIAVPPVPTDMFLSAVKAAVSLNAGYVPPHETGAAMYVRPQLYASSAQLGLNPSEEYTFCVFVMPTGVYHGAHAVPALILDEFDRAAPNGTGSAKVGGNYAPVLRWSERARGEGFGITLHLDSLRHEEVDEFSTSAFIGALVGEDGEVTLVGPDSKNVIKSVTAESIFDIARSFGWKVERRSVKYSELPNFKEVMAAGTAAALVPIRSITRRMDASNPQSLAVSVKQHPRLSVNETEGVETITYIPGTQEDGDPLCLRLLAQLKGIQLGKVKDEHGWCFPISEEDGRKVAGSEAVLNGRGANGNGERTVDQLD